jgi:hypothetical protein
VSISEGLLLRYLWDTIGLKEQRVMMQNHNGTIAYELGTFFLPTPSLGLRKGIREEKEGISKEEKGNKPHPVCLLQDSGPKASSRWERGEILM